jgi:hypothetical protein
MDGSEFDPFLKDVHERSFDWFRDGLMPHMVRVLYRFTPPN